MGTRWARVTRGWVVAVFSTLVAGASHTVAGGVAPSGVALLIATAFAGVTCVALTGTRVSLPRVILSVLLSQFAFHTVFASLRKGATLSMTDATAHAHASGGAVVPLASGAVEHHDAPSMWVGHTIAAALTIVALRYGEAAFWHLRALGRLFSFTTLASTPAVPVLPRVIRRPDATVGPARPRRIADVRRARGLRGPPAGAFA
ncbi:MAG: hypothetical protein JWM51_1227 [Microbacteriaceae bacterium]|nr:hypothetical protein [Microbacteriaceae bacterium]